MKTALWDYADFIYFAPAVYVKASSLAADHPIIYVSKAKSRGFEILESARTRAEEDGTARITQSSDNARGIPAVV